MEKSEIILCIPVWKDFLRHHEKKANHRTIRIMRFIYLKMHILKKIMMLEVALKEILYLEIMMMMVLK